jgi:hypothetical protein
MIDVLLMVALVAPFVAFSTFVVFAVWRFASSHDQPKVKPQRQVWIPNAGWMDAMEPPAPVDPLVALKRAWLADPRPAWETVGDFEREVERVMRGERAPRGPGGLPPIHRPPAPIPGVERIAVLTDGVRRSSWG